MRTLLTILLLGFLFYSKGQDVVSKKKAIYLMCFVKYAEKGSDQYTIGVMGESPLAEELRYLAQFQDNVDLMVFNDTKSIKNCDMVFLPNAQSSSFSNVQNLIGKSPILLVVEDESLIHKGAEIGFFEVHDQLKYAVNKPALDDSGVHMSERLLAHAKVHY